MQYLFLDFETYYDKDYSLRKMTPVEYILDPRFECIGCAFKWGLQGTSFWVDGPDLQGFFDNLPQDICLISHNALFDMCIVVWRYGYVPRVFSDTLGISRACLAHRLKSLSLENVAAHLGIGVKGKTVHQVSGMHAAHMQAAGLWEEYKAYACNDADLCAAIWDKLVVGGKYPFDQIAIMDMIIRCCVLPKFRLDRDALALHYQTVVQEKEMMLAKAQLAGASTKTMLNSNEQFAELLRGVGIDPPKKISPSTGLETYAFAKSDADFMDLLEHPDPRVQALVAARLGNKSTLAESRAQRLLAIADLEWPEPFKRLQARLGEPTERLLPVPLKIAGAHTLRLSGDWKLNLQNLPARKDNSLRRALICGPDEDVVIADSAQIQARLVACMSRQLDLVEAFRNGDDIYSIFATDVFGYPVSRATKMERFVGKQAVLGLGFGLGWRKFQRQLYIDSLNQLGTGIEFDDDRANFVVTTYRTKYPEIPKTWKALNYTGMQVLAWGRGSYEIGGCVFEKGAIVLPNGMRMFYHDLQQDSDHNWFYRHGALLKKTYGGALMENIAQALEQVIMNEIALRVQRKLAPLNIRLALQEHDGLAYICKKEVTPVLKDLLAFEMGKAPEWMPDLPLLGEPTSGSNFGEAK